MDLANIMYVYLASLHSHNFVDFENADAVQDFFEAVSLLGG
jgi:hypothetical protein